MYAFSEQAPQGVASSRISKYILFVQGITRQLIFPLQQVHASDLLNSYGGGELADYAIQFVTNLDPNGKSGLRWPKYTTSSPNLLTLLDGLIPQIITQDTFRKEAIAFLTNVTLAHPI